MRRNLFLFFGVISCIIATSCAQSPVSGNEQLYYGVDKANKIIVCHEDVLDAVKEDDNLVLDGEKYRLLASLSDLKPRKSIRL